MPIRFPRRSLDHAIPAIPAINRLCFHCLGSTRRGWLSHSGKFLSPAVALFQCRVQGSVLLAGVMGSWVPVRALGGRT